MRAGADEIPTLLGVRRRDLAKAGAGTPDRDRMKVDSHLARDIIAAILLRECFPERDADT